MGVSKKKGIPELPYAHDDLQRGLRRLCTAFHLRGEWLVPETVARDAGWPQMARQVRRAAIRTRGVGRSPACLPLLLRCFSCCSAR